MAHQRTDTKVKSNTSPAAAEPAILAPPEAEPADGSRASWKWLAGAVATPTTKELTRYAIKTPTADLIAWGAGIGSPKVLTDLLRACSDVAVFWPTATAEQKKLLLGFSSPLLSVTVHAGLRLVELSTGFQSANGDRSESELADETAAAADYAEGMDVRERLANALGALADYDPTLGPKVAKARGRVSDAKSLADSLAKLVKLARAIRSKPASGLAEQLEDGGVTEALCADVDALATRVKTSGARVTGARKAGPVTQAELDHQDGICLTYYARMMKIFNAAHAKDPTVPQIVPIATRSLFTKKKSAPGAPTPPTPPDKPADT
jgi:hypothetical protein